VSDFEGLFAAMLSSAAVYEAAKGDIVESASTTSTVSNSDGECDADVECDAGEENDEDEQQMLREEDRLAQQLRQYSASQIVNAWAEIFEHLAPASDVQRRTPFHSSRAPNISVADYFARVNQYFQCSDSCLILGPLLIDRLVKMNPDFEVSKMSIHRLLATSVMIAAKYHDDVYYSNSYYAKVAGIPVKEINRLEACFLSLIKWQLGVCTEEFEKYLHTVLPQ
jgi:hypothetical protein